MLIPVTPATPASNLLLRQDLVEKAVDSILGLLGLRVDLLCF